MHPDDGRVVSNLIVQALRGEPLTIYGDGSQTRSFCYVDDLIEGMTLMMDKTLDFTGPINLGNPSEFTIKEIAEIIKAITNTSSPIVYKDLPSDDPKQRKPNNSLAKEKLDWEPKVKLEEGLKKTILYFEKALKTQQTVA